MLSPYRIVDLTTPEGWLCGQLLAQLGAEVIVVEPPHGHDTSAFRPRWRDAYLRGRVYLTGGAGDARALAATADAVLVTADSPVDVDALRTADPGLITVSLTPWGRTGPKAEWKATDLIVAAASGHMAVNGDDDRPPVRVSEPQVFHHASTEAVVHLIAALAERRRSGRGQHLDVSAHQCMLQATQSQMLSAAVGAVAPQRYGGGVRLGDYTIRLVYPALDGPRRSHVPVRRHDRPLHPTAHGLGPRAGPLHRRDPRPRLHPLLRAHLRRAARPKPARRGSRRHRPADRHLHQGRVARSGDGAQPAHRPGRHLCRHARGSISWRLGASGTKPPSTASRCACPARGPQSSETPLRSLGPGAEGGD